MWEAQPGGQLCGGDAGNAILLGMVFRACENLKWGWQDGAAGEGTQHQA